MADIMTYVNIYDGKMSVFTFARCLSVRHTPIFCLNGYIYPQSFFSPSGIPTMLVFKKNNKQGDNIPMGTPNRAVTCKPRNGYAKLTIFDQYIALSRT